MDKTLTDISGIGASAAGHLTEAGFTSIEDVAKATPETLGKAKGFGPARAGKVIAAAKSMLETKDTVEPVKTEPVKAEPEKKTEDKIDVDPAIAAMATGKFATAKAFLSKPHVLSPAAAIVILAGVAAAFPGEVASLYDRAAATLTLNDSAETPALTVAVIDQEKPAMEMAAVPVAQAPTAAPVMVAATKPAQKKATARQAAPRVPGAPYFQHPYYRNNAWGNGWGNGAAQGGFSMSFSGKSSANGRGYGYNQPYYGAPYGFPHRIAYRPPVAALKKADN